MITQPLEITHSVEIIGNDATLLFQQGRHAPPGRRPRPARSTSIRSLHQHPGRAERLHDQVRHEHADPLEQPAGRRLRALFDPENNPAGIQHAVIDTRDSNTNLNMTLLTLDDMTILGPPAFDGSSFSSLKPSSCSKAT